MPSDVDLPPIGTLGHDLLLTTRAQRLRTLVRPFVLVGVYGFVYAAGGWWITPLVVFLIFIAIVTSAHDLVHGSLGLDRRATRPLALRARRAVARQRSFVSSDASPASPRVSGTRRS